jgi:homoserine kinase
MPWLPDFIAAARAGGAAGAALSGAGPSVIALTWRTPEAVQRQLLQVALDHDLRGRSIVSRIRNYGARIDMGLAL